MKGHQSKLIACTLLLFLGTKVYCQTDKSDSLNNAAIRLKESGNIELAIGAHKQALALRVAAGNLKKQSDSYNNLATTWLYKGQMDSALAYYQKSVVLGQKVFGGNSKIIAGTYNNISVTLARKKKYPQARQFAIKALAIFEKHNDSLKIANTYHILSNIATREKNFSQALSIYRKIKRIYSQKYGSKSQRMASLLNDIAGVHKNLGSIERALKQLNQALSCNTQAFTRLQTYTHKAKLLCKLKRYKKCLHTLYMADSLVASIRQQIVLDEDKIRLGIFAEPVFTLAFRVSWDLYKLSGNQKYVHLGYYFAERNKANALLSSIHARTKQQAPKISRIADIQDALESDQVLLEYHYDKQAKNLFIFTIGKNLLNIKQVANVEKLGWLVENYRTHITTIDPDSFFKASVRLYKILIKPVLPYIKTKKHLIVINENEILQVPFYSLLPSPPLNSYGVDHKSLPYLIKNFTVTYCPSTSLALALAKKRNKIPQYHNTFIGIAPIKWHNQKFEPLAKSAVELGKVQQHFKKTGLKAGLFLHKKAAKIRISEIKNPPYIYSWRVCQSR